MPAAVESHQCVGAYGPFAAKDVPRRWHRARYLLQLFKSTRELLTATSTWLTDDLVESIEKEISAFKDPVVRHGNGMRLLDAQGRGRRIME